MGTLIYSDFTIEENMEWDKDIPNLICYLMDKNDDFGINSEFVSNIHNDIVVKNKDNLFMRIPFYHDNKNIHIHAVIEDDILIVNYNDVDFIEYLKEKWSLYQNISWRIILLQLFQYFSITYTEKLIKIEGLLDDLFENAVYKDAINLKELLSIKKEISIMKRNTTFYRSMLSYLEEEFNDLALFDKISFILDNTFILVENVETSIFSCIDIYNSVSSNKMNKTMQLLTIITVISLPATIVTGIFGMNFENMPLINRPFGFILSMLVLMVIILFEVYFFKKRKYL
ncbi:magnesium transporter CorA family protein [Clostridium sp. 'White wine YQ']|uniref:magnesium transporter CorA family protein n=1 Tax=Clostridium sp. 'White wine YQ' TaxID=3027474 RepID=UPI0023665C25|nr:CorA family divalent cation transporter [Clostridium sp. 'White wine YQ']MDD7793097.1 CorA family divalent cation transporter [Clostridium sp. 'White wine YQ']